MKLVQAIVSLSLLLIASLVGAFGHIGAGQTSATSLPVDWRKAVKDEAPLPKDAREASIREARAKVFDDKTGIKRPLDVDHADSEKAGRGMFMDFLPMPPFPAAMSDAVFVGQVTGDFQPFLSEDHTTVFTELRVRVEKVYKDTYSAAKTNGLITIPELGGTLRLKTGWVVSDFAPKTQNRLELGHRYLIFAIYVPAQQHFGIVKLWELVDGHARPLANSDVADAAKKKTPYAGMNENDFLAAAQKLMFRAEKHQ
jgi:hypothetical protein